MCTISWLSSSPKPLQVVLYMQLRHWMTLGGAMLLIGVLPVSSKAEDKLQTFVNSSGKVVITNVLENTPSRSPAVSKTAPEGSVKEAPESLRALVDTISHNHGIDPGLVHAVIKTESNFNRFAVSDKGALGLMQLIPSTGRRYGVQDFFDPQQNVDGGVRYLKFLLQKFNGDLDLSLAAYNAGENLVERLGRVPPISETRDYVRKVRAIYNNRSVPAAPANTMLDASKQETPKAQTSKVFKVVDARGVTHFSNVEPPN
jgi:transglycosylase-like protein with SLT domain